MPWSSHLLPLLSNVRILKYQCPDSHEIANSKLALHSCSVKPNPWDSATGGNRNPQKPRYSWSKKTKLKCSNTLWRREAKDASPAELIALSEGGREKQETDEEKTWLVLHKESKQAQKMQHPEKLNQEAKDKTSPGQCDPENNNDNNDNSKIHTRIHNGVKNGEEKKAKEEFTKEKEERGYYYCPEPKKRKRHSFKVHNTWKEKSTTPEKKRKTQNKKKPETKKPKTKRNSKQKKQKIKRNSKQKTCLRRSWVRTKLEYKITDTIHYNTFASKTVLPITSSELIYNSIIIMHLRVIRGQTSVCCKFVAWSYALCIPSYYLQQQFKA